MMITKNNSEKDASQCLDDDYDDESLKCSSSTSTCCSSSFQSSSINLANIYNHTLIKIRKRKQRIEHMKWLSQFLLQMELQQQQQKQDEATEIEGQNCLQSCVDDKNSSASETISKSTKDVEMRNHNYPQKISQSKNKKNRTKTVRYLQRYEYMNAMPLKQQFFESGNWNYLPLPAGLRVSLITKKTKNNKNYPTFMVDENGKKSKNFQSFLGRLGNKIGSVILDAVYIESAKRIYILDLIYWNEWFTDHPFQVRQFFLRTKLNELSQMLGQNLSLGESIIPGQNQVTIRQLYYQIVDKNFKANVQNSCHYKEEDLKIQKVFESVKGLMSQFTPKTNFEEEFIKENFQKLKNLIKLDQYGSIYLVKGYIFVHSESIYMSRIQNDLAMMIPSVEYIFFQNYFKNQALEQSAINQWRKQLTLFIDPDLNFKTFEGVTIYRIQENEKSSQKSGVYRVKFNQIDVVNQNIELIGVSQTKRIRGSNVASISEVIFLKSIISSDNVFTVDKLMNSC